MGQVFVKAPVTSYFIIGYSIGFTSIWFAHEDAFMKIRSKLFPSFEKTDLKVHPTIMKMKVDEEKVIENLIRIEIDKKDEDYDYMKKAYGKRMQKYAEIEQEWYDEQQSKGKGSEESRDLIHEYDAVRRINHKNNKF